MYCTSYSSYYFNSQWGLWDQERLAKYSLRKRLVLSRLIPVAARSVNLVADGQGLDPQVDLITMTNGSRQLRWKVWKVHCLSFIVITVFFPLRATLSNISPKELNEVFCSYLMSWIVIIFAKYAVYNFCSCCSFLFHEWTLLLLFQREVSA